MTTINLIIFILFVVYIIWTWNSTKEFETTLMRISYIAIGTIFIAIITWLLFVISKIGVEYPKEEMIGQVRKIVLLVFIPINGFIVLTQCSSIFSQVRSGIVSKEDLSKKIKIRLVILAMLIIFEVIYFKHIQYGIINVINVKQ